MTNTCKQELVGRGGMSGGNKAATGLHGKGSRLVVLGDAAVLNGDAAVETEAGVEVARRQQSQKGESVIATGAQPGDPPTR